MNILLLGLWRREIDGFDFTCDDCRRVAICGLEVFAIIAGEGDFVFTREQETYRVVPLDQSVGLFLFLDQCRRDRVVIAIIDRVGRKT